MANPWTKRDSGRARCLVCGHLGRVVRMVRLGGGHVCRRHTDADGEVIVLERAQASV